MLLLPLLLLFGCDTSGPTGLVDFENGVRTEVMMDGIEVENTKREPINAVAFSESARDRGFAVVQTIEDPGQQIGPGETRLFPFDDNLLPEGDDAYIVTWILLKGEGSDREIGERGSLELAR
ncbi:MAG: hypothetical protein AAF791_14975 [Bacteroidota bacterium]